MSNYLNKELEMRVSDNKSSEFAWLNSYETLGAVDGPGLRLILFLQGCSMHCLFCHNPETLSFSNKDKKITIDEVIELYQKNRSFYDKNGGITLSGGEAMAQINFVIALFKRCKELGIHTTIDTAAGPMHLLSAKELNDMIKYTDIFLIDLKHPNNEISIGLTGTTNDNQKELIRLLEAQEKHYWVRHVLVPTFSDAKEEYMIDLGRIMGALKYMDKFELLPYHNMAVGKYDHLGWGYPLKDIEPPSKGQIQEAIKLIRKGMEIVQKNPSKSLI